MCCNRELVNEEPFLGMSDISWFTKIWVNNRVSGSSRPKNYHLSITYTDYLSNTVVMSLTLYFYGLMASTTKDESSSTEHANVYVTN